MANYHVSKPKGADEWTVRRAGAERISDTAPTQAEAEQIAERLAATRVAGRFASTDGMVKSATATQSRRETIRTLQKIGNTDQVAVSSSIT